MDGQQRPAAVVWTTDLVGVVSSASESGRVVGLRVSLVCWEGWSPVSNLLRNDGV